MKKIAFLFALMYALGACKQSDVMPESRHLVGKWQFSSVKAGKLIDFCQDDITSNFQDKFLEFTQDRIYIRSSSDNSLLLEGTWRTQQVPVSLNNNITYNTHLTTQFPAPLQEHNFSWDDVNIEVGNKRLSFRNCAGKECFRYDFRK